MSPAFDRDSLYRASDPISFPTEEEKILSFWQEAKIFENGQQRSSGKRRFTFYDGPPFATGLPHYGHILTGTIKDVVTRYAYAQGYHVERRFGWDCHGLPVEYEIDKAFDIRSPEQVEQMGIAAYNDECRKIVMRYVGEWRQIVKRMGRWIDFENDYRTMYPWYMESVWWVFKQLFDKGLVYQGVKVMPYSTRCRTALSNFEAGQNYKHVRDPCVLVALELVDDDAGGNLLIWTTTPWTLPANLAVCVHPDLMYVKIRIVESEKVYILGEAQLKTVFQKSTRYEILERFVGKQLANLKYKPLFPYFTAYGTRMNCFRVLVDEYVTSDVGSGIVHQAPFFGEDDYRVCLNNGIVTKTSEVICPIDECGCFTNDVIDFAGQYVKDADKNIIKFLERKGVLFSVSQTSHSYPFCWRSDTPLIYKAVSSWFIRVEEMSEDLLATVSQTYWVPDNVKTNRFGNWLKNVRDWAVSRKRYWGTPLPIWMSPNGDEIVCIGSIKELETLSGHKVSDLHRESIDHIEIPSVVPGRPPLRRVSEVFDCWFESGSMPYAQQHFPFKNMNEFLINFPADFIAEGIDQTRGWFYTLLVISTALFNKPPFKNLIANGLVLAADGQKMSKSKKNYPDPMEIVNKHGADALRLYLINSPVVKGENLRFQEDGVCEIVKKVLLPFYNAYRFLVQNIHRLEKEDGFEYFHDDNEESSADHHVMDVWILSAKENLLAFITQEMAGYRLYTVVPRLVEFIDQLTNWYVRLNRRRIKGESGGKQDSIRAVNTLFEVLLAVTKAMAPFTPYFAEYLYQRLVLFQKRPALQSIHYEMNSAANLNSIDESIELTMSRMQSIIKAGRMIRDRCTLPLRCPIQEIIVIHNQRYLQDLQNVETHILEELNARRLTKTSNWTEYGIRLRAKPKYQVLGDRLKSKLKAVAAEILKLNDSEVEELLNKGSREIQDTTIYQSDIQIVYEMVQKPANIEMQTEDDLVVLLNTESSRELVREGVAREVINRIQKLKKKAKLKPTDLVVVKFCTGSDKLENIIEEYQHLVESTIKSKFERFNRGQVACSEELLIEDEFELDGSDLKVMIFAQ